MILLLIIYMNHNNVYWQMLLYINLSICLTSFKSLIKYKHIDLENDETRGPYKMYM